MERHGWGAIVAAEDVYQHMVHLLMQRAKHWSWKQRGSSDELFARRCCRFAKSVAADVSSEVAVEGGSFRRQQAGHWLRASRCSTYNMT